MIFPYFLKKILNLDLGTVYYGSPIANLNLNDSNSTTVNQTYYILVNNEITEDTIISGFEFYAVQKGQFGIYV